MEDFDYVRFRFAIVHEFDEFWADQRTEMLEEGPATSKASGIITKYRQSSMLPLFSA